MPALTYISVLGEAIEVGWWLAGGRERVMPKRVTIGDISFLDLSIVMTHEHVVHLDTVV